MNEVLETEPFREVFESCDQREKDWIERMEDQLASNLTVGKPLGFPWFREKKLGNKRLFYVINEKTKKALLIAFGSKKEQEQIINHVLENMETYLHFLR